MIEAPASSVTEEGWRSREKAENQKGARRPGPVAPCLRRESWSRLSQPLCERGGKRGDDSAGLPRPHPTRFQYFAERHAAPNRSFPG